MKFSHRSRNAVNILKFIHDTHLLVRRSKVRKLKKCHLNIYGFRTFTFFPSNQPTQLLGAVIDLQNY